MLGAASIPHVVTPMPHPHLSSNVPHVATPNGLWPAECVHAVPSGTGIRRHPKGVEYTFPNGTVSYRAPCPHATPPRPRPKSEGSNSSRAELTSHAYPMIFWGTRGAVSKFTATYNVPKAPTVESGGAGQTVFWWFGVEPTSAADVLQPVLGWNGFNHPGWTFASWNCCPAGHTHYAPPLNVSTGDVLFGALDGTGGDGYEIVSAAKEVEAQSVLRSNDATPQVDPLLTLETYNIDGAPNCDLLPAGPLVLENIATTPAVTSWGADEPQGWGIAASCGWSVKFEGDTLTITPPAASAGSSGGAAAAVEA